MTKINLATARRRACVPVFAGSDVAAAIRAASAFADTISLVGLVELEASEPLSAGAAKARQMRKWLRELSTSLRVRGRSKVLVSHQPWVELRAHVLGNDPDILVIGWVTGNELALTRLTDFLAWSPCDMAVVRGPLRAGGFPRAPKRLLVPIRGGPYAELALRLGLTVRQGRLCALHLRRRGDSGNDAAYSGLAQVLAGMPDVETRSMTTDDVAQSILDEARGADLIIMGAAARPAGPSTRLGPAADRILAEAMSAVAVIKTRRQMPESTNDELVGAGAISILVDKWFAESTFHADEFADLQHLLALKNEQRTTISLALPALNEAATVGRVIRTLKRALMEKVPLVDEIVLIDSNSTDATRSIATKLGIPVYIHQEILPELGPRRGKGEALWKSLMVTRGDIVAWIDTDIENIHPRFVYGILGPLLVNEDVNFVKGFYRRPLRIGDGFVAGGGGRVTELTARPLLNLFYPALSGVVQPLSGEYAGRRSALERCPFFSGYGVEIGLLIDIFERYGIRSIAQVDLLERVHHNQSLEALGKMSFAIIQAVMRKLERSFDRRIVSDVNKTMKLIRWSSAGYHLDVEEIAERERPPMRDVSQYRKLWPRLR